MQRPCLILFFTRNTSLKAWDDVGMFDREVTLYRRLQDYGIDVTFVTYGGASDLQYSDRIPGIRIVCNRWGLSSSNYIRLLTWVYPLLWRGPTVIKSNQTKGAQVAMQAAHRCGKPFVTRCGYLYSEFMSRQNGADSPGFQRAEALERRVFTKANQVVVTTSTMRDYVVSRYGIAGSDVRIIPNYVDTEIFRPGGVNVGTNGRICFVGRLEEQKNLLSLIEGCRDVNCELVIVGTGSLDASLRARAKQLGIAARFLGNLPNHQLPALFSSVDLFVLPSHYEGHPKALIEAMANGLPVIGSNVLGIRELIRHGQTGWLCGTDAPSIRSAIIELLSRPKLRAELAFNARQYAVECFSLDRVVEMELTLLDELAA